MSVGVYVISLKSGKVVSGSVCDKPVSHTKMMWEWSGMPACQA